MLSELLQDFLSFFLGRFFLAMVASQPGPRASGRVRASRAAVAAHARASDDRRRRAASELQPQPRGWQPNAKQGRQRELPLCSNTAHTPWASEVQGRSNKIKRTNAQLETTQLISKHSLAIKTNNKPMTHQNMRNERPEIA